MTDNKNPTNKDLYDAITEITKHNEDTYLRKDVFNSKFEPVKLLLYGLTGLLLTGIILAMMSQVVK